MANDRKFVVINGGRVEGTGIDHDSGLREAKPRHGSFLEEIISADAREKVSQVLDFESQLILDELMQDFPDIFSKIDIIENQHEVHVWLEISRLLKNTNHKFDDYLRSMIRLRDTLQKIGADHIQIDLQNEMYEYLDLVKFGGIVAFHIYSLIFEAYRKQLAEEEVDVLGLMKEAKKIIHRIAQLERIGELNTGIKPNLFENYLYLIDMHMNTPDDPLDERQPNVNDAVESDSDLQDYYTNVLSKASVADNYNFVLKNCQKIDDIKGFFKRIAIRNIDSLKAWVDFMDECHAELTEKDNPAFAEEIYLNLADNVAKYFEELDKKAEESYSKESIHDKKARALTNISDILSHAECDSKEKAEVVNLYLNAHQKYGEEFSAEFFMYLICDIKKEGYSHAMNKARIAIDHPLTIVK